MTTATPNRRPRLGARLLDALAGPHGVDGYLEQIRPTWAVGEPRAEVISAERRTPDSVTLGLRANRAWAGHRAGQFVRVGVEVDGARRTRCYSPTSAEGTGRELEITVRIHDGGVVSNFLCDRAHPGMFLWLSEADGDFALPERLSDPVLLISGGSGITPVMSMLRTLCARGHDGPVTFLHYARDRVHALYADELDRLAAAHPNVSLVRCFTREPGAGEADGHFRREHLLARGGGPAAAEAIHRESLTFACGPSELLDAVRDLYEADGVADRLRTESFTPPTLVPASGEAEGVIRFTGTGIEVANDGTSILGQAEAAGLSPDSGCRMGICHSCTCRKTAGVVRNLNTGETGADDEEQIQVCISAPVGDVSIEL